MKNLTWQNPEQLFVAQELIKKVKLKCCGIKVDKIKNTKEFKEGGALFVYFMHFPSDYQCVRRSAPPSKNNYAYYGEVHSFFSVDYQCFIRKKR